MLKQTKGRTMGAALIGLVLAASATIANADIQDYEFRTVDQTVKTGYAEITVQLIDKRTGKAVPDAVIFAKRLDMTPDGMDEMDTKIAAVSSTEPGVYRFSGYFSMAGRWQLSLAAKVQGEAGTVESKLLVKAEK